MIHSCRSSTDEILALGENDRQLMKQKGVSNTRSSHCQLMEQIEVWGTMSRHCHLMKQQVVWGIRSRHCQLTLILLTWTIWRVPSNVSKWRMGFNSAFKGLMKQQEVWGIRSRHCQLKKQKEVSGIRSRQFQLIKQQEVWGIRSRHCQLMKQQVVWGIRSRHCHLMNQKEVWGIRSRHCQLWNKQISGSLWERPWRPLCSRSASDRRLINLRNTTFSSGRFERRVDGRWSQSGFTASAECKKQHWTAELHVLCRAQHVILI